MSHLLVMAVIALGIVMFVPVDVLAQKVPSKAKLLKNAKNALYNGDIFTATDNYRKCDDNYPQNAKLQKKLAYLYWQEKNYSEAQKYFSKTYRNDSKTNLIELFYSAKCQQIMGNYEDAKKEYERFASVARSDKSLREYVKRTFFH